MVSRKLRKVISLQMKREPLKFILKIIEELNELSVEVAHLARVHRNEKEEKKARKSLLEERGDVAFRLKLLDATLTKEELKIVEERAKAKEDAWVARYGKKCK